MLCLSFKKKKKDQKKKDKEKLPFGMQLAFRFNPHGGEGCKVVRARAQPPGWNNSVAVVSRVS